MSEIKTIMQEGRPIAALWYEDGEGVKVGVGWVTKIKPYLEPGEMANVTWFAVYRNNGFIHQRINSSKIAVVQYDIPIKDKGRFNR